MTMQLRTRAFALVAMAVAVALPAASRADTIYDFSGAQDLQGWAVLNGVANFSTGDGGGMGPANAGNTDYAHDGPHPTFLVESPEIFLDPALQPGDKAMVWVTAGGAGDQANNGPDFANPAEVLAYNGGRSNDNG